MRRGGVVLVAGAMALTATGVAAQQRGDSTVAGAAARAAAAGDTVRLGLADAVRIAAERSAQVDVATSQVAQARSRVTEARSALLPQVNATVAQTGRTFNTATFGLDFPTAPGSPPLFDPDGQVEGPVNLLDVRGSLSQTLFNWAAIKRVHGAKAAVEAQQAGATAAREAAATSAARAYVGALRSEARRAALSADVSLARELLGISQELLDAGIAVRLDVTRAEAQVASLNAQLVGARQDAAQSRLALLRALNLPLDVEVALTDSLAAAGDAATPAPDAAAAVAVALENRADLHALEQQIDAAESRVSAIRAERLPRLAFVGDDGWIGKGPDHLLNTYDWAVQVQVPVFDGMRRGARVDEANAQVAAIEAQRRDLRSQVEYQVRSALLDLSAAQEQADAAATRLRLAQEELDQARERFSAGVAGTADVITASLRLSDARAANVNAQAALAAARVALAAAQGTVREIQ